MEQGPLEVPTDIVVGLTEPLIWCWGPAGGACMECLAHGCVKGAWEVLVVQSLSCVWLFAAPRTAAGQASLSFATSQSLLKLMSAESVMPSNHLVLSHPLLLLPSILPSIRVFGASASASVIQMNIQDWFPLGLTGWISLQSKELSRVFSNTTVRKHQFFWAQVSLWSNSHICTWLLEKTDLSLYRPLLARCYLCFLISCLGWS